MGIQSQNMWVFWQTLEYCSICVSWQTLAYCIKGLESVWKQLFRVGTPAHHALKEFNFEEGVLFDLSGSFQQERQCSSQNLGSLTSNKDNVPHKIYSR